MTVETDCKRYIAQNWQKLVSQKVKLVAQPVYVKLIANNFINLYLVNHVVYTAHATDRDSGQNGKVSYSMYQVIAKATTVEPFKIDPVTGELSIDNPIDYEKVDSYRVIIKAQDGSPTNPRYCEKNAPCCFSFLFRSMGSIVETKLFLRRLMRT